MSLNVEKKGLEGLRMFRRVERVEFSKLSTPSQFLSTSVEKIIEKRLHGLTEAFVGNEQDDERQRENPEETDGEFQKVKNEPQRQQAGDESEEWIFK